MKDDDLVYKAPRLPKPIRRVYVLPRELMERIHQYGYDNGHPSEVSAARELIEKALQAHDEKKAWGG